MGLGAYLLEPDGLLRSDPDLTPPSTPAGWISSVLVSARAFAMFARPLPTSVTSAAGSVTFQRSSGFHRDRLAFGLTLFDLSSAQTYP